MLDYFPVCKRSHAKFQPFGTGGIMRVILLAILTLGLGLAAAPASAQRNERLDRLDRSGQRERAIERADRRLPPERSQAPLTHRSDDGAVRTPDTGSDPAASSTAPPLYLKDRDLWVRPGEILALNLSPLARSEAGRLGLREIRTRPLGAEGALSILASAVQPNPAALIAQLERADPDGLFTLNPLYQGQGPMPQVARLPDVPDDGPPATGQVTRIGLIDGRLLAGHPLLAGLVVADAVFTAGPAPETVHGTAVALRLVESFAAFNEGERPNLISAGVLDADGFAAADAIAGAIAWMSSNDVWLVNISLAGPENLILARLTSRFLADGGVIVAASGNGGPLSRSIFPAAYPGVTGVSACADDGSVYPLATPGEHVDMAAPGVDVRIAGLEDYGLFSGTSYAAPVVTAWLASDQGGLSALPNRCAFLAAHIAAAGVTMMGAAPRQ